MNPFFEQVYDVVGRIPYGKVASYGQIARMLGRPRAAREVGWAMRCCPEHLPWQRVVMSDGSIAGGEYCDMRKMLLEAEKVPFLPDGRVDMKSCVWLGTEVFNEIESHLLNDAKPSDYLKRFSKQSDFNVSPFDMLARLKATDQQRDHHPEGNVWNHTLLTVDEAAKRKQDSSDPRVFMWAALVHDIGKPDTTRVRKGRITSYDHDKAGAALTVKFFAASDFDESFINAVAALVRWHMQILFVVKDLPFADVKSMREQVDINDVALLGLCDRLGRGKVDVEEEKHNIEIFLSKSLK